MSGREEELKESWRHGETNEAGMTEVDRRHGLIRFDFFWLAFVEAQKALAHGHGAMIAGLTRPGT